MTHSRKGVMDSDPHISEMKVESNIMLSETSSRNATRGKVPVYLNVYDLTPMNCYAYWFGLGIYHSGIEVHGVEYGFGAHECSSSGLFEVQPKQCPGFVLRKSIQMGTTHLTPKMLRDFIEHLAGHYSGNSYHLILKNCNHFSNDLCLRLTGNPIPGWVNRLARLGLFCNCMMPVDLHVPSGEQTPPVHLYEREKEEPNNCSTRRTTSIAVPCDSSSNRDANSSDCNDRKMVK